MCELRLCAEAIENFAASLERANAATRRFGEAVKGLSHKRRRWRMCCLPVGIRQARGHERRVRSSRKGGAVRPRKSRWAKRMSDKVVETIRRMVDRMIEHHVMDVAAWHEIATGAGLTKEEAAVRCLEVKAGDDVWNAALQRNWILRETVETLAEEPVIDEQGQSRGTQYRCGRRLELLFPDGTSLVRNSARELWDELVRSGRIEPEAVRKACEL